MSDKVTCCGQLLNTRSNTPLRSQIQLSTWLKTPVKSKTPPKFNFSLFQIPADLQCDVGVLIATTPSLVTSFAKFGYQNLLRSLGFWRKTSTFSTTKTVTKGGVYELKNLSPAVVYNRPTCLLAGLTLDLLPNAATKVGFCWVFCARGSYHSYHHIILPPLVYSIN